MRNVKTLIVIASVLVGCTKAKDFEPTTLKSLSDDAFGPSLQDTNLAVDNTAQSVGTKHQYMKTSGFVQSGDVMKLSEALIDISSKQNNAAEVGDLGKNIMAKFYSGDNTVETHGFEESHLMQAVMSEIKNGFQDGLNDFTGQSEIVTEIIRQIVARYSITDRDLFTAQIAAMVTESREAVLNSDAVTDSVKDSIDETFTRYLDVDIPEIKAAYDQGRQFTEPVGLVDHVIERAAYFNYELEAESVADLQGVRAVGVAIAAILTSEDKQAAMTATTKAWRIIDPDDTEARQKFQEQSSIFYNILVGASEGELDCLESTTSCGIEHFAFETFQKNIVLSGWPDALGTKASLAESVTAGTLDELWVSAQGSFDSFVEGVGEAFTENEVLLTNVTQDVEATLRTPLIDFGNTYLQGKKYTLLENNIVKMEMEESSNTDISGGLNISQADTSAYVFGAGLSAMAKKWNVYQDEAASDLANHRAELISALNKIFEMGGYTNAKGEVYNGIARATANPNAPQYDLTDTDAMDLTFSISNSESIKGQSSGTRTVKVGDQAEVLKGLAAMVEYLEDWRNNAFNPAFDDYRASLIMTAELADLAGERADKGFITKEDMYALAVGQLAVQLKGLSFKGSPLALITADGYQFVQNEQTVDEVEASAVTVVGWTNGNRDKTVKVRELADYLYAMTRVYKVLGDIEKTNSEKLLDISKGDSAVQQLIDARKDSLRSLMVGMSSFLTGKARGEDGGMAEEVALDGFQKSGVGRSVRTQAHVMRALMAASEALGLEAYQWAAHDIYFYLNKNAWDSKLHFYKLGQEQTDIFVLAETLSAMLSIKDSLPEDSGNQLQKIVDRWIGALRTF